MAYFNRDNRSFRGNRPVRRPEMHDAICSSCGKPCQLPFKPTGDRPVYCKECFAKNGGGEKSFGRNAMPQKSTPSVSREQLDAINTKLDKILNLLGTNTANAMPTVAEATPFIKEATPVIKKGRVSKKAEVPTE